MTFHIYAHDDRVEILSTRKQGTVWLTNGRFITVRMDDGTTWKGQTDEIRYIESNIHPIFEQLLKPYTS